MMLDLSVSQSKRAYEAGDCRKDLQQLIGKKNEHENFT